jgi:hypothetical protein
MLKIILPGYFPYQTSSGAEPQEKIEGLLAGILKS